MVLDAFAEQTGATVRFRSAGDDVAAYVGPRIEGGDPPDVAILPQPGVLQTLREQGDLVEIEDVAGDEVDANFGSGPRARPARSTARCTASGSRPRRSRRSGTTSPSSREPAWSRRPRSRSCRQVAQTISDYGVAPYSIGADVGWPLSDLFENIYLRTAGPDMYDQLATHEIPWTDQSVKDALTVMGGHLRRRAICSPVAPTGAEQTDFNGSVTQVFADPPEGRDDLRGRLRRRHHQR